jgi:uncharacterized protein (DUF736 family)
MASDQDTVEGLIDRLTLRGLLDLVAQVCHEKADHLRANWQDETAGHAWERVSETMEKALDNPCIKAVS